MMWSSCQVTIRNLPQRLMKIIEGILYVEFAEMVDCGVSEKYIWKAKSTGTRCWSFINDPADKRRVLIAFESLRDQEKAQVRARSGVPYAPVARQPLLAMVQPAPEAHDFYFRLQYAENGIPTTLGTQQVAQSTPAAAWLALIG